MDPALYIYVEVIQRLLHNQQLNHGSLYIYAKKNKYITKNKGGLKTEWKGNIDKQEKNEENNNNNNNGL